MRLPRDLSGEDLAVLLGRYDYEVMRQTGSPSASPPLRSRAWGLLRATRRTSHAS